MRFTYQHNGQTYMLDLVPQPNGQYSVSIGDRTVSIQAQALPNGGWRLRMDRESHTVYATAQGDQRFVQVDAATYTLSVPGAKSPRRTKTSTNGDELSAQIKKTCVVVQTELTTKPKERCFFHENSLNVLNLR